MALERVRERIARAGGDPGAVAVVAVTKGFGAGACIAALDAGHADLGENYAQELLAKHRLVAGAVRWHFLGRIQRRKVRDLAGVVHLWHGVARASEGRTIAAHAPGAAVLVEVDFSGSPDRNGCPPDEVPALVDALSAFDLDVRGLMTVAPRGGPDEARRAFSGTRRLAEHLGLAEVSMGMSGDLELAVAEGATIVRVGSALFGYRPPRAREQ